MSQIIFEFPLRQLSWQLVLLWNDMVVRTVECPDLLRSFQGLITEMFVPAGLLDVSSWTFACYVGYLHYLHCGSAVKFAFPVVQPLFCLLRLFHFKNNTPHVHCKNCLFFDCAWKTLPALF